MARVPCANCDQQLASLEAGHLVIRHAGRTTAMDEIPPGLAMQCERCGWINKFTPLKGQLDALTVVRQLEVPAGELPVSGPVPTTRGLAAKGKAN